MNDNKYKGMEIYQTGADPGPTGPEDRGPVPGNRGSRFPDKGCFLTSACIKAKGLPDDCEELTVLRRYRDEILMYQKGGAAAISEYYRIAPGIILSINSREDADEIWDRVYGEMILPCAALIREERYREAFSLYFRYTVRLAEECALVVPEEQTGE